MIPLKKLMDRLAQDTLIIHSSFLHTTTKNQFEIYYLESLKRRVGQKVGVVHAVERQFTIQP